MRNSNANVKKEKSSSTKTEWNYNFQKVLTRYDALRIVLVSSTKVVQSETICHVTRKQSIMIPREQEILHSD